MFVRTIITSLTDHHFTGKHRIAVCPEPCLLYVWQLQDVLVNKRCHETGF